jgi:shikimate kinase
MVSSLKKIFLIGMPGSGKTTVGKLLAEKLGVIFYDLDAEIELHQGESITVIFNTGGESMFRKIETQVLQEALSVEQPFVMAAGGGTPCFYDNLKLMNKAGITIYLDVALDLLVERTQYSAGRPLLRKNHQQQIQALWTSRQEYYQQAHYKISATGMSVEETVKEILLLLGKA